MMAMMPIVIWSLIRMRTLASGVDLSVPQARR